MGQQKSSSYDDDEFTDTLPEVESTGEPHRLGSLRQSREALPNEARSETKSKPSTPHHHLCTFSTNQQCLVPSSCACTCSSPDMCVNSSKQTTNNRCKCPVLSRQLSRTLLPSYPRHHHQQNLLSSLGTRTHPASPATRLGRGFCMPEEEDAATLDGLDALGSEAACILSALEPRSSRPANSSPTLPSYC